MGLPLETGVALINKALEAERDERLFQQWVAQLPFMDKDTFVSFPEYVENVTGANIDRRSTSEILRDLDEVEKLFQEGGTESGS